MLAATNQILIIQTAFIGDAILASSLIETWHAQYPDSSIDLLVRKGNESLYDEHPFLNECLVWNKKEGKYASLMHLLKMIRARDYDAVFNVQRFAATGVLCGLSKANIRSGFSDNPLSFLFTHKTKFTSDRGLHEIDRNFRLIKDWVDIEVHKPRLYPREEDYELTKIYKDVPYICMAPTSVWYTKQWPKENWIELIREKEKTHKIYLLGGLGDVDELKAIQKECSASVEILAGRLGFLASAALMRDAEMNYVNDSAPMHIASSMNAPVTAIYCSTIPGFGFGPLSTESRIVEVKEDLACRPCGLHGKKECPEGHFNCSKTLDQLIT